MYIFSIVFSSNTRLEAKGYYSCCSMYKFSCQGILYIFVFRTWHLKTVKFRISGVHRPCRDLVNRLVHKPQEQAPTNFGGTLTPQSTPAAVQDIRSQGIEKPTISKNTAVIAFNQQQHLKELFHAFRPIFTEFISIVRQGRHLNSLFKWINSWRERKQEFSVCQRLSRRHPPRSPAGAGLRGGMSPE